jgi:alginate O-acetyltransferase complex protein AlgI
MISFIADCYTGKITKPQTFINTAAYFTMFPQITQGPIMRFDEKYWETKEKTAFQAERFEKGVFCFIIGLCLKVLLADRIGILWNEIDKIGFESISTPLAWLGAYGYSFKLYFDFFGYSLMAAGLGMMLGFPFVENFHHPYASDGVAKFYRDWHVTLGAWFRDYIYFPLGGSHCSKGKNIRNLLIVWLITGLWHGGTLNFVIWGLVLGLIIIWEKFVMKDPMEKFKVIGHLHVLVLIPLTWVIFAIPDLGQLGLYFTRLFPFPGNGGSVGNVDPGDVFRYLNTYWPLLAASAILCVPATYRFIEKLYSNAVGKIILIAAFWVAVYYMTISSSNAFMYFSF